MSKKNLSEAEQIQERHRSVYLNGLVLLELLLEDLLERIRGYEMPETVYDEDGNPQIVTKRVRASAAELNVAAAVLRNNGIELDPKIIREKLESARPKPASTRSVPFPNADDAEQSRAANE